MAEPAPVPGMLPPPAVGRPALDDRGAIAVAVAAAAGAWWARPVPMVACLAALVALLVRRRPLVLVLAVGLAASWLGARSLAGLQPPQARPHAGVVTLVSDPVRAPFATRADVRVGTKRYELSADGGAGAVLGQRLAGERVAVSGRIRPPPPDAPWLVPRHVVGRLDADAVEPVDAGSAPWRAANHLRRVLERGVAGLPRERAALFRGLVIGDDRDQSEATGDDFRAAGLTHVLVVSGQNVAFVLAVAAPLIRRLRLGGRWAATLAVIAGFAVLTRFEPSVLRASAMAGLAVTATLLGRRAAPARLLALAVAGLLLVDPLLVRSVGFQLSVGASAGIIGLSGPVGRALPGPRWLAEAVGVTIAAQVGVAPVQIPRFGGIPVASFVANPLAVPVAGLVAGWGLSAGLLAGIAGGVVARTIHVPTHVMVWWIAGVARVAAGLPLGEVAMAQVPWLVAGAGSLVLGRRTGRRVLSASGAALVVIGLVTPALALRAAPPLRQQLAPGVTVWRAGGGTVLTVDRAASPGRVLEAGRRAGVRRVDLVLLGIDAARITDLLDGLEHRWPGAPVRLSGARSGRRIRLGDLVVDARAPPGAPGRVRAAEPAEGQARGQ